MIPPVVRQVCIVGIVALIYFFSARLGLALALGDTNASPVWPPSGFALAALIIFGRNIWPGLIIGAFVSNLFFFFEHNHADIPIVVLMSFVIAVGNTLESLIAHHLLKLSSSTNIFSEARKFFTFLMIALVACTVSASIGTLTIFSGKMFTGYDFFSLWGTWWMGDFSGMIILAPLLLTWFSKEKSFKPVFYPWVIAATFVLVAAYILIVLGGLTDHTIFKNRVYHFFLLLIWCSFCMNLRQLSVVILMTALGAIYYTINGTGPFIEATQNESLLAIQFFLCIVCITAMLLSITLHERKLSEEYLRKVNTELENTKAELVRSMNEKDRFVANMSHEIRTPMNAIIGFTDLMLTTPLNPEQKQYTQAVRNSGDNLLIIINDILDFSRIRSGKVEFEQTSFSLNRIMTDLLEQVFPRTLDKKILLHLHVDDKIPEYLIGDPTRLNQILLNLVSNAVKFTEKGRVDVRIIITEQSDDAIVLSFTVEDTGIGIRESRIPRIFDAFTQENNETTRKYGGSGLGLTIVKQLVELQGGIINVTSEVNKGTIFTFSLSFRKDFSEHKTEVTPFLSLTKSLDLKILVVEDNLLNQMLVEKVLRNWNCEVDIVDTGFAAIQILNEQDYDIILMDIQLPEMDGYEATRYIRNNMGERGKKFKIIAFTAHAMIGEAEKCYNNGMNGYLSKPFNPDLLYKKITALLERKENLA
jgi:signal transduction histidine kinase/CheY-like chemotaxis protein